MIEDRTENHDTAIHHVLRAAFDGDGESQLVDDLRDDGDALVDRIWTDAGRVVGYVMFSRMAAPFRAAALAPVAVDAAFRQKGIADALIRDGIKSLTRAGCQGLFVLGDPGYYQRFGFDVDAAKGFTSPYSGPYFQFLAIETDIRKGRVDYAPAFARL